MPLQTVKVAGIGPSETRADYYRRWRAANREYKRAKDLAWREQHREHERERARRWRAENLERARATDRARNPERLKVYRALNPERKRLSEGVRRAKRKGVDAEAVDRMAVFHRDGFRCQLCGQKTRGRYPAPTSPSLDHIVPLSKGGSHSYDNTQCACLACNVSKGAL